MTQPQWVLITQIKGKKRKLGSAFGPFSSEESAREHEAAYRKRSPVGWSEVTSKFERLVAPSVGDLDV